MTDGDPAYLRCPGCKAFVLFADLDTHIGSGHKDKILKEEKMDTATGATHAKPVSIWIQIIDMVHTYPKPWLLWTIIAVTGGYLLAWYSIFR